MVRQEAKETCKHIAFHDRMRAEGYHRAGLGGKRKEQKSRKEGSEFFSNLNGSRQGL